MYAVPVGARRRMIALGLIAAAVVCASGCGDDDESDTDTSAVAVARPEDALRTFSTGLEGQGLVVSDLPRTSSTERRPDAG
jgi:hypothetical protein